MKVIITYGTDNYLDLSHEEMEVLNDNGEKIAQRSVYPLCECPEDAILERDLVGCFDIFKFMQLAYEAGKNGESLELVKREETEND